MHGAIYLPPLPRLFKALAALAIASAVLSVVVDAPAWLAALSGVNAGLLTAVAVASHVLHGVVTRIATDTAERVVRDRAPGIVAREVSAMLRDSHGTPPAP